MKSPVYEDFERHIQGYPMRQGAGAAGGGNALFNLQPPELRALRGDANVARQRQSTPLRQTHAVDGRDARLPDLLDDSVDDGRGKCLFLWSHKEVLQIEVDHDRIDLRVGHHRVENASQHPALIDQQRIYLGIDGIVEHASGGQFEGFQRR